MLETEYKSLLTEQEYKRLEDFYSWDSVEEQTNHYYCDKDGILAQNRIMFRIRERCGKSVIQVKLHKNEDSPLQICEELEFPTDGVLEEIEDGERYTGIKTAPLNRLGASVTLRHSKMWDKNTEICLDKTEYLGVCDYELEIEYTSETMPEELMQELKTLGIEFKQNSVGKYSRFLDVIEKAEKEAEHI